MKKSYTYSEIIFGAREEYEKIREKLKRLAEITKVQKEKQVLGLNYLPFLFDNYFLYCKYEQNPHTIRGLDDRFRQETGYYQSLNIEKVIEGPNNHYQITDDSKYGIHIP
jgi:hypothetical protein